VLHILYEILVVFDSLCCISVWFVLCAKHRAYISSVHCINFVFARSVLHCVLISSMFTSSTLPSTPFRSISTPLLLSSALHFSIRIRSHVCLELSTCSLSSDCGYVFLLSLFGLSVGRLSTVVVGWVGWVLVQVSVGEWEEKKGRKWRMKKRPSRKTERAERLFSHFSLNFQNRKPRGKLNRLPTYYRVTKFIVGKYISIYNVL